MPDSNAYQERVFSASSYFDTPLRNRLKVHKYEMQTLVKVNRSMVTELAGAALKISDDVDVLEQAEELLGDEEE